MLVLIRGAGDLATGVAVRLLRAGMTVALCDLAQPTAIRRTVAFSEAIRLGQTTVEGIAARRAGSPQEALSLLSSGLVPVLCDEQARCIPALAPDVLVDAILAKRNLGTRIDMAPIVVALGPGFTAGVDAHAVVETMRGHDLGRVYYAGSALPNTGVPGEIGGQSEKRVLRAPADGPFLPLRAIGDAVAPGETVATVGNIPMRTEIGGVLRGILPAGLCVTRGFKCADVDPRCRRAHCYSISDKARALGGGVLEAILHFQNGRDAR